MSLCDILNQTIRIFKDIGHQVGKVRHKYRRHISKITIFQCIKGLEVFHIHAFPIAENFFRETGNDRNRQTSALKRIGRNQAFLDTALRCMRFNFHRIQTSAAVDTTLFHFLMNDIHKNGHCFRIRSGSFFDNGNPLHFAGWAGSFGKKYDLISGKNILFTVFSNTANIITVIIIRCKRYLILIVLDGMNMIKTIFLPIDGIFVFVNKIQKLLFTDTVYTLTVFKLFFPTISAIDSCQIQYRIIGYFSPPLHRHRCSLSIIYHFKSYIVMEHSLTHFPVPVNM